MRHKNLALDIVSVDDIKQTKRKTGQISLSIDHKEGDRDRRVGKDVVRVLPAEFQTTKAYFRQEARQHDQTQHHGQQEVEQIVSGVHGGYSHGKGKDEKACPLG